MKEYLRRKELKNKELGNKGFTLVELIVVIVIIAILAAFAIPALTGYIEKAKEKSAAVEGRNILAALQSSTTFVYGFGTYDSTGGQDGMLNWNGGSIQTFHNKDDGKPFPSNPTIGFTMIANPNSSGILTARALKEVSLFLGEDEATVKKSLYALIVQYDTVSYDGKSDNIAAFVYKIKNDKWVAYNSKDNKYEVFSNETDAFTFAKRVSPYF